MELNWDFSSKKAMGALTKFRSSHKNAVDAYHKENNRLRLGLIRTLEKELKSETKAKNRKEATKIEDAIEALKNGLIPPSPKQEAARWNWATQRRNLIGRWSWRLTGVNTNIVTFNDDGSASGSWGGRGKWKRDKDRVVITWQKMNVLGHREWDTVNFPIDPNGTQGDS